MYRFVINSAYNFNDIVDFKSKDASGRGRIFDIVLTYDGKVYYIIERDDGDAFGGIFPHEMSLVSAAKISDS